MLTSIGKSVLEGADLSVVALVSSLLDDRIARQMESVVATIKRYKGFEIQDVSIESWNTIASPWIPSHLSKLLCISIAVCVANASWEVAAGSRASPTRFLVTCTFYLLLQPTSLTILIIVKHCRMMAYKILGRFVRILLSRHVVDLTCSVDSVGLMMSLNVR